MEEIKLLFTDITPLCYGDRNALFTAFYQGNKVVIKCIKPELRGSYDFNTDKQSFWIDGSIPNEIYVYEYMQSIPELQNFLPKFYCSITEDNTENFDNRWLCEEYLGNEDVYGIHGYLVIEYIEGKTLAEYEKESCGTTNFWPTVHEIIDLFESHYIRCCDVHTNNILIKSDESIIFIDFEMAELD